MYAFISQYSAVYNQLYLACTHIEVFLNLCKLCLSISEYIPGEFVEFFTPVLSVGIKMILCMIINSG